MIDDDTDEDEYMTLLHMHQGLWAVNRELVDRIARRLSWTAFAWGAGGFWFGICIGLVIR